MEGEETPVCKGRKRVRRPLEWSRNKRKKLRNSGKAYKTSKGIEVKINLALQVFVSILYSSFLPLHTVSKH